VARQSLARNSPVRTAFDRCGNPVYANLNSGGLVKLEKRKKGKKRKEENEKKKKKENRRT
jgi:hypothetical protein